MNIETVEKNAREEFSRAKVDLGRSPPGVALINFYRRLDSVTSVVASSATSKVACKAGCSYCCYFKVEARASEVLAINEYINARFTEVQRDTVLRQAKTNVAEAQAFTHEQHLSTNQRCSLLFDDQCSVYSVRPSKCRNFHATDVDGCKQSFDEPTNLSIPNSFVDELVSVANGMAQGFEAAQKVSGFDSRVYDLNSALLESFANPKAAKRLRGRKRAFLDARIVSVGQDSEA